MNTEATINLLRAVGEALAPFLPEGGSVDTEAIVEEVRSDIDDVVEARVSDAIDEIDFDEKVENYMRDSFDPEDHDLLTEGNFDPSDYDCMTEGNFDPSMYNLITDDEVDEKIADIDLTEMGVVTVDNILSVLANALGGLPAVEQAA